MPITKRQIVDDDGNVHDDWKISDDTTGHVVATGGAVGYATLADGTTYDLNAPLVEVANDDHAQELHHHIGKQHEMTGRFDNPALGLKWRHAECRHCDSNGPVQVGPGITDEPPAQAPPAPPAPPAAPEGAV